MSLRLSYAPSLTSPLVLKEFADTAELAAFLASQKPVANKVDSAIIVPAVFKNYPVQANERTIINALETTACILDYDAGDVTADEIAEKLDALGLDYTIRPSFSDSPECPRFCAIIPWSAPLPVGKHRAAVEQVVKPLLNGKGHFALESSVAVQARFIQPKAGTATSILLPDADPWMLTNIEVPASLPAAAPAAQAADPLALVDTDPGNRQLFRLALNYIDADKLGREWVAVLGCGMRMFGITPEALKSNKLSGEQWSLIADLEAFSARGSEDKYRKPENGIGIDRCTAKRLNGDGDWVPSMVMQNASRCLYGTSMTTLTGIIKRTDFFAFESELSTDFPELVEQARDRFNFAMPVEAPLPSESELKAAALEGERRVAKFNEASDDYYERMNTLLDRMPEGPARKLATTLATGGVKKGSSWFMHPPAAVVLATQIINVVMANRVWVKTGVFEPLPGNTYAYQFDDSGSGKSARISFAMGILTKAGYGHAHYDGKVHSAGGMHSTMMSRGQTMLMTADELKSWFSNVGETGKPNANQTSLDAFMLRVWLAGCRDQSVVPDARAGDRAGDQVRAAPPIKQPNISTFMIGVPEDMKFFSDGMLGDGSLARSLCFVPPEDNGRETEENRIRRMAKRRSEMRRGDGSAFDDKQRDAAVAALLAFDRALEQQGLGVSHATVEAGVEFDEANPAPRNMMAEFRNFVMARAELPDNMVRILYCDGDTLDALDELDLKFALAFPGRKVESIVQRYVEKSLRLALCLTMFDNPAAEKIEPTRMRFALELVALAEDPWLKLLLDAKQEITLKGNKFEKFERDIRKLLEKGGLLHSKPAGFSLLDIRRDKRFHALYSVVSKLNVGSEAIRRDAQTMLDALSLSPMKNPSGKGYRIFHPDHRPEPNDDDQHD